MAESARRARGGGGAARRAARTAVSFETARYIERNIPNFEVLTEEALQIIEQNADTVLEEIGVNFPDNPDALALWRNAGADVQGERVRIPRGLARKLCSTAPSTITQVARNRERDVVIGGKSLVLAPVYGPPFVRDAAGGRRYATMADFEKFVKLGYMSKWLHHSGGDGMRADRHPGKQTSPRYAACAYDAQRQALHGLGDRTVAGAGQCRYVRDPFW